MKDGFKSVSVVLEAKLWRKLKTWCALNDRRIGDVIQETVKARMDLWGTEPQEVVEISPAPKEEEKE